MLYKLHTSWVLGRALVAKRFSCILAQMASAGTEMDVGPFFFTQPNQPVTQLREMPTPVL